MPTQATTTPTPAPSPPSLPYVSAYGAVPARFSTMRRLRLVASALDMFLFGEVPNLQHPDGAPYYRVIQFDRTVAAPTGLPEIMLEHRTLYGAFSVDALVEGLYARLGLPIPTTSFFADAPPQPGGAPSGPGAPASSTGSPFVTSQADALVTLDIQALLGVVQFTKGYYLVVVTRSELIGRVGGHGVYGIRSAELVPIHYDAPAAAAAASKSAWQWLQERVSTADPATVAEGRYQSLFLNVDLTRDFYFSYEYDVTRTLQEQVVERVEVHGGEGAAGRGGAAAGSGDGGSGGPQEDWHHSNAPSARPIPPQELFHWNAFLCAEMIESCGVDRSWFPPLAYGFFRQVTLSLFGKPLLLTLAARRSRHFAGTRYLKRGASADGHVGNEVESEQLLDDGEGHLAAFTQVRGSVPVYWMQRANLAIPKPPILLQPRDLTYGTARRHFAGLFTRYGAPLLVLNLVKKKERGAREKLIGREFGRVAAALNKQLPPQCRVQYLTLDYSTLVKSKGFNVLTALRDAGRWTAANVGFFCNAALPLSQREKRSSVAGGGVLDLAGWVPPLGARALPYSAGVPSRGVVGREGRAVSAAAAGRGLGAASSDATAASLVRRTLGDAGAAAAADAAVDYRIEMYEARHTARARDFRSPGALATQGRGGGGATAGPAGASGGVGTKGRVYFSGVPVPAGAAATATAVAAALFSEESVRSGIRLQQLLALQHQQQLQREASAPRPRVSSALAPGDRPTARLGATSAAVPSQESSAPSSRLIPGGGVLDLGGSNINVEALAPNLGAAGVPYFVSLSRVGGYDAVQFSAAPLSLSSSSSFSQAGSTAAPQLRSSTSQEQLLLFASSSFASGGDSQQQQRRKRGVGADAPPTTSPYYPGSAAPHYAPPLALGSAAAAAAGGGGGVPRHWQQQQQGYGDSTIAVEDGHPLSSALAGSAGAGSSRGAAGAALSHAPRVRAAVGYPVAVLPLIQVSAADPASVAACLYLRDFESRAGLGGDLEAEEQAQAMLLWQQKRRRTHSSGSAPFSPGGAHGSHQSLTRLLLQQQQQQEQHPAPAPAPFAGGAVDGPPRAHASTRGGAVDKRAPLGTLPHPAEVSGNIMAEVEEPLLVPEAGSGRRSVVGRPPTPAMTGLSGGPLLGGGRSGAAITTAAPSETVELDEEEEGEAAPLRLPERVLTAAAAAASDDDDDDEDDDEEEGEGDDNEDEEEEENDGEGEEEGGGDDRAGDAGSGMLGGGPAASGAPPPPTSRIALPTPPRSPLAAPATHRKQRLGLRTSAAPPLDQPFTEGFDTTRTASTGGEDSVSSRSEVEGAAAAGGGGSGFWPSLVGRAKRVQQSLKGGVARRMGSKKATERRRQKREGSASASAARALATPPAAGGASPSPSDREGASAAAASVPPSVPSPLADSTASPAASPAAAHSGSNHPSSSSSASLSSAVAASLFKAREGSAASHPLPHSTGTASVTGSGSASVSITSGGAPPLRPGDPRVQDGGGYSFRDSPMLPGAIAAAAVAPPSASGAAAGWRGGIAFARGGSGRRDASASAGGGGGALYLGVQGGGGERYPGPQQQQLSAPLYPSGSFASGGYPPGVSGPGVPPSPLSLPHELGGLLPTAPRAQLSLDPSSSSAASLPNAHVRSPMDAADRAAHSRYTVCCGEAQDAVTPAHPAPHGGPAVPARLGIGVRMRQFEAVGGSGEYLYINLRGTPHGYQQQHHGSSGGHLLSGPAAAGAAKGARQGGAPPTPSAAPTGAEAALPATVPPAPARSTLPQLGMSFQAGVVRTNCVDCLDRTNVAQVCIGVHMLGLQMYALGLSDSETLDSSGAIVRNLMELYESMGDVIALQYGGSEANKKVTTAEHAAADEEQQSGGALGGGGSGAADRGAGASASSSGGNVASSAARRLGASSSATATSSAGGGSRRDSDDGTALGGKAVSRLGGNSATELLSSLQRYYANSFTDSVKQASMNVFLGLFRPRRDAGGSGGWIPGPAPVAPGIPSAALGPDAPSGAAGAGGAPRPGAAPTAAPTPGAPPPPPPLGDREPGGAAAVPVALWEMETDYYLHNRDDAHSASFAGRLAAASAAASSLLLHPSRPGSGGGGGGGLLSLGASTAWDAEAESFAIAEALHAQEDGFALAAAAGVHLPWAAGTVAQPPGAVTSAAAAAAFALGGDPIAISPAGDWWTAPLAAFEQGGLPQVQISLVRGPGGSPVVDDSPLPRGLPAPPPSLARIPVRRSRLAVAALGADEYDSRHATSPAAVLASSSASYSTAAPFAGLLSDGSGGDGSGGSDLSAAPQRLQQQVQLQQTFFDLEFARPHAMPRRAAVPLPSAPLPPKQQQQGPGHAQSTHGVVMGGVPAAAGEAVRSLGQHGAPGLPTPMGGEASGSSGAIVAAAGPAAPFSLSLPSAAAAASGGSPASPAPLSGMASVSLSRYGPSRYSSSSSSSSSAGPGGGGGSGAAPGPAVPVWPGSTSGPLSAVFGRGAAGSGGAGASPGATQQMDPQAAAQPPSNRQGPIGGATSYGAAAGTPSHKPSSGSAAAAAAVATVAFSGLPPGTGPPSHRAGADSLFSDVFAAHGSLLPPAALAKLYASLGADGCTVPFLPPDSGLSSEEEEEEETGGEPGVKGRGGGPLLGSSVNDAPPLRLLGGDGGPHRFSQAAASPTDSTGQPPPPATAAVKQTLVGSAAGNDTLSAPRCRSAASSASFDGGGSTRRFGAAATAGEPGTGGRSSGAAGLFSDLAHAVSDAVHSAAARRATRSSFSGLLFGRDNDDDTRHRRVEAVDGGDDDEIGLAASSDAAPGSLMIAGQAELGEGEEPERGATHSGGSSSALHLAGSSLTSAVHHVERVAQAAASRATAALASTAAQVVHSATSAAAVAATAMGHRNRSSSLEHRRPDSRPPFSLPPYHPGKPSLLPGKAPAPRPRPDRGAAAAEPRAHPTSRRTSGASTAPHSDAAAPPRSSADPSQYPFFDEALPDVQLAPSAAPGARGGALAPGDALLYTRYSSLAQAAGMAAPASSSSHVRVDAAAAASAASSSPPAPRVHIITDAAQIELFRRSVMSGVSAPGDDLSACARWTQEWGVSMGGVSSPARNWLASAFVRAALDRAEGERAAQYAAYCGGDLLSAPVEDVPVMMLG